MTAVDLCPIVAGSAVFGVDCGLFGAGIVGVEIVWVPGPSMDLVSAFLLGIPVWQALFVVPLAVCFRDYPGSPGVAAGMVVGGSAYCSLHFALLCLGLMFVD